MASTTRTNCRKTHPHHSMKNPEDILNAVTVTIVMIEDDDGHARLIERNIRRAGVHNRIEAFTSGTKALEYLFDSNGGPKGHGPLLILLDLNLRGTSGSAILPRS